MKKGQIEMAGRRPEPIEKRAAKGNPQRRPMPDSVPPRVESVPKAPVWLKGHGKTCWTRVSGLLFMRGQLSADSELSLVALCQCYAEWVELAEDIRANGRFQKVMTKAGASSEEGVDAGYMERVRPAVAAFQDCDRRLKGWLIEFGLTDASRGKVTGTPPPGGSDQTDPLERYGLQ
jgi:P27 family predicted phage terminase small subunit